MKTRFLLLCLICFCIGCSTQVKQADTGPSVTSKSDIDRLSDFLASSVLTGIFQNESPASVEFELLIHSEDGSTKRVYWVSERTKQAVGHRGITNSSRVRDGECLQDSSLLILSSWLTTNTPMHFTRCAPVRGVETQHIIDLIEYDTLLAIVFDTSPASALPVRSFLNQQGFEVFVISTDVYDETIAGTNTTLLDWIHEHQV